MKKILEINQLKPYLDKYVPFANVRKRLLESFDEFQWLSSDSQEGIVGLSWNGEIALLESSNNLELLKELVEYEA